MSLLFRAAMGTLLLFVLVPAIHAQSFDADAVISQSFDAQGNLKPEFQPQLVQASAQFQSLPSQVQQIFGNERVELQLKLSNGKTQTLGLVMSGDAIQAITAHAPENPTLLLNTDEQSIGEIMQSKDVYQTFILKVNQGKLKYEGKDAGTQSKLFVINIMVWITNLVNAILFFFAGKK